MRSAPRSRRRRYSPAPSVRRATPPSCGCGTIPISASCCWPRSSPAPSISLSPACANVGCAEHSIGSPHGCRFEPVGCLAEFRAEEFDAAARDLFGAAAEDAATGSQAYWRLLGLIDRAGGAIASPDLARLEELELAAVERADLYEDVAPSLEALRANGVATYLVSSLSRRAVARFIERFALAELSTG